ncbi:MAG: HEAT repeat domain-containing protein [Elusimicrobia bacterium]|nr:HEAT repeat domain-containing protein [Elusimicrobiota bacterium]
MIARILMIVGLVSGLFLLYRVQHQPPPPAPPPPPPRIELPPVPVLSEAELQKVRNAAKDADPQVRWAAIELLYRVRDPMASEVMRGLLSTDADPAVKTKAIETLQKTGKQEYAGDLILALKDQDKDVRMAALIALGELSDARAAPAVVEMLRDYEPEVRMQALHTMARFQEKRQSEYRQLAQRLREQYKESLETHKRTQSKGATMGMPDINDLSK